MSPTLLQEVSDDHHGLAGAKNASYAHSDPLSEIPTLSGVDISADGSTPIIDMEALLGPHRSDAIKQIGLACERNGFFAVKNHGIPEMKIDNMLDTAREFFHLPEEERLKFRSADPDSVIRLVTGFQDKTRNVFVSRQSLKFHCHPVEEYKSHWPSNPPSFRENVGEYCESVRKVEVAILEAISESLDLERDYIDKILKGHYVSINYYPACQESELDVTHGVRTHTDPTLITILMQDDVPGLQVINDDKWINVNPIPNAVVVHVGDILQAISNYKYKSLLHQAIVNCEKERVSIASYCYPSDDAMIGPAKKLIDKVHPAIYKDFTYREFHESMWRVKCSTAKRLDLFKPSSD
uniref:Fe2OG dioxygenase domain-containing protein n=1 Tax=Salix viminalis TaxID=40686 RepID=A0A6N2K5T8_SALVM